MGSHTARETTNLKIRVLVHWLFLEAGRENLFHIFFQLLLVARKPLMSLAL